MQTNFPLGPLAYAVIEQYGDLARTAFTDAMRGRQTARGCVDEDACVITGRLFGEDELASQQLQPGNWLSIGLVGDDVQQTLIEINLTDGSTRQKALSA